MTAALVVIAVWALSMLVILRLVSRMTPHYPPPDKWEPYLSRGITNNANRALSDYSDWDEPSGVLNDQTPLPLRACIHVEVTPGHEADVVDEILRTDLDMAREGL